MTCAVVAADLGAAKAARHRNTPQPAVGVGVDDLHRDDTRAVALGGAGFEHGGDLIGDGEGFRIAGNNMRLRRDWV